MSWIGITCRNSWNINSIILLHFHGEWHTQGHLVQLQMQKISIFRIRWSYYSEIPYFIPSYGLIYVKNTKLNFDAKDNKLYFQQFYGLLQHLHIPTITDPVCAFCTILMAYRGIVQHNYATRIMLMGTKWFIFKIL